MVDPFTALRVTSPTVTSVSAAAGKRARGNTDTAAPESTKNDVLVRLQKALGLQSDFLS